MTRLSLSRDEGASGLTVLLIGAHSDDIEIGCGGTVLQLLEGRSDVSVHWVVMSAPGARGEEARRSADRFLTEARRSEIVLHEFRDGFFPYAGAQIKEVFEDLKATDPDLIFTHYGKDLHQDHRLLAELTWNTFRSHAVLEYEIPKYDGGLGSPNVFVPLSHEAVDQKIEILMEEFGSQRSKRWFTEDTFRGLMRLRAVESPEPTEMAEAFYGRKLCLNLR